MRNTLLSLVPALMLLCAFPCHAGDVVVQVTGSNGKPVANTVVTISGPAEQTTLQPERFQIAQKDLEFDPFVLVIPKGAEVAFPNLDETRHHVYSFSKAGPFEIKLFGSGETRSVVFDKAGIIAIGCNIHDMMTAFIKVVDDPWMGITDEDGRLMLSDIDAGNRTLTAWHPHQKGSQNAVTSEAISVSESGTLNVEIELAVRKPLMSTGNY